MPSPTRLSLIEINPAGVSAMYRLTVDLGVGYARRDRKSVV